MRIILIYAALFYTSFFAFTAGLAQAADPEPIHLIVHDSVADTGFMVELECMLRTVFTSKITVHKTSNLRLGESYNSDRMQYDARIILDLLGKAQIDGNIPQKGYVFYFFGPDIYKEDYNFLFALMDFDTQINVVALSRLGSVTQEQTTDRVFRIVAKNIAKFAGHRPSGKCFMGYSNSLQELENRAVRLCEPDLEALKAMGLVKPSLTDGTVLRGCLLISHYDGGQEKGWTSQPFDAVRKSIYAVNKI